ncbi:MAG: hypothetical protein CVT49_09785 [candidate division Zixibacteria bacterium HGW-Zixibacteria-1]|nr:MAG: hypothetical protein CVT49_09785 [candidate division Zixibacteria bacterium HGW-Zixibacteria-1]
MELDKKDRDVITIKRMEGKIKAFYRHLPSGVTWAEFQYFMDGVVQFLTVNAHECADIPHNNSNLFKYESITPRWLNKFVIYFTVEEDDEGEYIILQDIDYN